jgi:hypothetical protein
VGCFSTYDLIGPLCAFVQPPTDLLWGKLEGCEDEEEAEGQAQDVTEVHVRVLGQGAVQQPGGTVGKDAHEWQGVELLGKQVVTAVAGFRGAACNKGMSCTSCRHGQGPQGSETRARGEHGHTGLRY